MEADFFSTLFTAIWPNRTTNMPHLRVIGGTRKGARLRTPSGLGTRPLLGRIKEALFSILDPLIGSREFLDLFAGSGSVGIEALSRGAAACTFVEQDAACVRIIKENLHTLELHNQSNVMRADVRSALRRLDKAARQFDLIFIGPPYGQNLAHQTLIQLARLCVVAPDGIVIAQIGRREILDKRYGELHLFRTKTYGDTTLRFYRRQSS